MNEPKERTDAGAEHNAAAWGEVAAQMDELRGMSHELIVRPAMERLAGDVEGKQTICLGCGDGEELEWLAERGAGPRAGLDLSIAMAVLAGMRDPEAWVYLGDLNDEDLGEQHCDLLWAEMSLHYAADIDDMMRRCFAALRPGGAMAFVVPHAAYAGAEIKNHWHGDVSTGQTRRNGWVVRQEPGGRAQATVDGSYLQERLRRHRVDDRVDVKFWVRSVERLFAAARGAGFAVDDLVEHVELKPDPSDSDELRAFKEVYTRHPFICGMRLVRPLDA
jgi:SAM-dependent methyltransferase